MGITAMIPDMTIGQLMNEAAARYGEIWDPHATRMTLLLLCPRKERKMMELHGDMIDHGQPVVSVFHRPRAEAHLLEAQGFDPRAASFMFVNIATADMGPWMQQLVNNEGWLRNSIQLASTPFSVGLPSQRPFEAMQTLCFRHPRFRLLSNTTFLSRRSRFRQVLREPAATCRCRNGASTSRGPWCGPTGKTSTTRTGARSRARRRG